MYAYVFGKMLVAFVIFAQLGVAECVVPYTYMVTSGADSGPGTLRQAICDANATHGGNIVFSPTFKQLTIHLHSPLPPIIKPIHIDGFLHGVNSGGVVRKDKLSQRKVLLLSLCSRFDGITINAQQVSVSGLAFGNFNRAIVVNGACGEGQVLLQGNSIGTDSTEEIAIPNNTGIDCDNSSNCHIEDNLVVASYVYGIRVNGVARARLVSNTIRNNFGLGLVAQTTDFLRLEGCLLANNQVGIYTKMLDKLEIRGCTFDCNTDGDICVCNTPSNGCLFAELNRYFGVGLDGKRGHSRTFINSMTVERRDDQSIVS